MNFSKGLFNFSIIILILSTFAVSQNNKHKGVSRFDRHYNECKNNDCISRPGEEDCIFSCISKSCYDQIFSDYLIELGEFMGDIKNKFEACFNAKSNKNKYN
jgi:hypothetical protein